MLFLVLFCPPWGGGVQVSRWAFTGWANQVLPRVRLDGGLFAGLARPLETWEAPPKAVSPSKRQVNWGSLGC